MARCKVLAFLLCDNATRDRDGKITLHGLFDRIIAPKTRNEVRLFYAYYRVVVEEPCVVFMKVAGPEGYEVPGNWRDSLTGRGPMQTVWALSSELFKLQGSYSLELRQEADDSEPLTLAQMSLTVEESEDHSK